jgi:hypothetical protein
MQWRDTRGVPRRSVPWMQMTEEFNLDDLPPAGDDLPSVSHHGERDAALAAVMRHTAERDEAEEQYREGVEKHSKQLGAPHLVLAISTVLALWTWIWPPTIIRIDEVPRPPVVEEESTLRLVMYFQAQKIEQYLLDFGRIPEELPEAGPVFPGMEYIRLTNRHYRLLGHTDRLSLSFSSAEPVDDFVGRGARVLDLGILQ